MYLTLVVFCLFLVLAAAYFKDLLPHLIQYVFFVRFSMLVALALVLLPLTNFSILPDLFELRGSELTLVTILAFFVAWTSTLTAMVTIETAPHRFGVAELHLPPWAMRYRLLLSSCLALPMLLRMMDFPHIDTDAVGPVVLGVAIALVSVWALLVIREFVVPPDSPRSTLLPERLVPRSLRNADPFHFLASILTPGRLRKFPRVLGAGYIDYAHGRFRPGPLWLALLLAMSALACTWANLRVDANVARHAQITLEPTLAYVEIGLIILALFLPGVAFFFDRYRISVVLVVALWTALPYWTHGAGHYFPIYQADCAHAEKTAGKNCPLPAAMRDAIEPWLSREEAAGNRKPVMVIVCASGGGSQATAWTTRVLTGLQEEFGPAFTRSIRLASGVSGGSVGIYYFLASYDPELRAPSMDQLPYINEAARVRSDEGLARGMIERGLVSVIFPIDENAHDRAWSLQSTWSEALLWKGKRHSGESRLSQWSDLVESDHMPGAVFIATQVESGRPLLFSTVDIPSLRRITFDYPGSGYSDADIDVLTAVRLSASFAWISPAASARYVDNPELKTSGLHIVDGAYVDAYGVVAASAWARDALNAYRDRLSKIVLIQIRSREPPDQPADPRSLFVQALAPLFTLNNVMIANQFYRDLAEVDDLIGDSGGQVQTVVLTAHHGIKPSWSLPAEAIESIEDDWQTLKRGSEMSKLRELLGNEVTGHDGPAADVPK
ncbi:MAG TPA: hypothetical protein VMH37_19365 [Candidatus Binataceae bacterium]|nr:hypothetical protein [Candidatus Binataceae bacterium]